MKPMTVPVQGPDANQSSLEYWLSVGEEGTRLRTVAEFTGFKGWGQRLTYLEFGPSERNRKLKEATGKEVPRQVVGKAEVRKVTDNVHRFGWEMDGLIETGSGRRLLVLPLPGLHSVLVVPPRLPEARTSSIFMPYLAN